MILVLGKPVATISLQLPAPLYPKLTIRNQVGRVRLRWFRLKGRMWQIASRLWELSHTHPMESSQLGRLT